MPPEQDPKKTIKSLRTYQGDVDEILSKGKASSATILVAEQKRKIAEPEKFAEPVNHEKRNRAFLVTGITLVLIGLLAVGIIYYLKINESVTIQQKNSTIITYSTENDFSMANSIRDSIITNLILEKQNYKGPLNSILYINLTNVDNKKPANLDDILSIIAPNMSSSLTRSFENNYMFGAYSYQTNEPFILIKVKDYASAYAGMLDWEKNMVLDIGKLFQVPLDLATSTSLFVDEAFKNNDLRILKDQNRKIVLLYAFWIKILS
jgi:hypothetical protein